MKNALKWYVLSNVHIALCAVVFLIGGFHLLEVSVDWWLITFIGLGTWMIYILHRYIGGQNLTSDIKQERFQVSEWPEALFFPIIGLAISMAFYAGLQLTTNLYVPLGVLGLVSAAYILPLFGNGRRLRDIGKIKIYLIAIVWAGVFVLPFAYNVEHDWLIVLLIWIEKALFIFALTLPFDIRDKHLDASTKVSTLASTYNDNGIIKAITILLLIAGVIIISLFVMKVYSTGLAVLLILLILAQ